MCHLDSVVNKEWWNLGPILGQDELPWRQSRWSAAWLNSWETKNTWQVEKKICLWEAAMEIMYSGNVWFCFWSICRSHRHTAESNMTKSTTVTMMQYISLSEILCYCINNWDLKLFVCLQYLYSSVFIFCLGWNPTPALL